MSPSEQNAIKEIYFNSHISMREIARILGLAGATSAAYIVDSLERKGYVKKVGSATRKEYILTDRAYNDIVPKILHYKFETLNLNNNSFFASGLEVVSNKNIPQYFTLNSGFGNGSSNIRDDGQLPSSISTIK